MKTTVKRFAAVLCLLLCIGLLGGCTFSFLQKSAVLGESRDYPVSGTVTSLRMEISAADVVIKTGDAFSVESNLRYLDVTQRDGVLVIEDQKRAGLRYDDAMLTLCIPEGTLFDTAHIVTGAGRFTLDALRADTLTLVFGAGEAEIDALYAESYASIKGGVGEVTIRGGSLRDLRLEMGVGTLDLTAALPGMSELKFGVGDCSITLLGNKADYAIDAEDGLGHITVDADVSIFHHESGDSAKNVLDIETGVGDVDITFKSE